jgi:hypothetical protein
MEQVVKWPNVWTSEGKFLGGDVLPKLPPEEVEALRKAGAISGKRGRKKESTDAQ